MVQLFSLLVLPTIASLSPDTPVTNFFSDDVLEQMHAQLSDTCGTDCTELLSKVIPLINNITVTPETMMDKNLLTHQFELFNSFFGNIISSGRAKHLEILNELNQITTSSSFAINQTADITNLRTPPPTPPPQPGLPCRTQTECDALDFKINRCSVIRQEVLNAYTGANVAVNVLANLMSVLCGCIFAGPVKVCVLKAIPYVCGFPFVAYQGMFSLSMSLWAAVTITNNLCSSVGPTIL